MDGNKDVNEHYVDHLKIKVDVLENKIESIRGILDNILLLEINASALFIKEKILELLDGEWVDYVGEKPKNFTTVSELMKSLNEEDTLSKDLMDYVDEYEYNCECQVGGVDAISIDTDYLKEAAKGFSNTTEAINRVRELHAKLYSNHDFAPICEWDEEVYPCATIEALEGRE